MRDAVAMLTAMGASGEPWKISVPGEPVSKARARWSRKSRSFYTPSNTTGQESLLAMHMRSAMGGRVLTGNVAVVAVFYRSDRQRIDADNLMKLALDAGTLAGVWDDDCQVTAQASFVELDREHPRTEIAIAVTGGSLDRERMVNITCVGCGALFQRDQFLLGSRNPPRYCSRKCKGAALKTSAACARCSREFIRKQSGQRYCSRSCAVAEPSRRLPAGYQRQPPLCTKCGGRVSRREYLFCQGCRRKGRKPGSKNRTPQVEIVP